MKMPELSQEEAREFIAKVKEGNGGISAEDRDFVEENRPSVLRALRESRRQLVAPMKIVVDNLYSKETRFLYELIQNAEDNSYCRAIVNDEKPSLTFKVYPDKIIIDSNEDGFSEDNVRAICSVGTSTKKYSAGYIGEKGIGFKSVFKIARKVHIQSGPFSFAFLHTRDDNDDGLGMITPEHEHAEKLPTGVRTRMTLTLLDSTKFEEQASEFRDIPDTLLMFLGRLQRLSIVLCRPDNTTITTRYSKRETKESELCTTYLSKVASNGQDKSVSRQKYYIMKSELQDLPFDEARIDKQGNSIDRATVVLAFPVNKHDEPVLKQQYTFAFLPLRQVGFKFLIQADFVTQANREDVVHSKRNQAILRGVAVTFANAVVVLCKCPPLRYQWMRYLPKDSISGEFWGALWDLICEKLEHIPLLESWSGKGLYKPCDLKKLPEYCLAEDQNPLLPDSQDAETYLSPNYTSADFETLRRLGTTELLLGHFIDRLKADLRADLSNWKNVEKSADWRTRICNTLLRAFANKSKSQKRLKRLSMIPLQDGTWISSTSRTDIYFPNTDDIPIPTDLGLNLVLPTAAENAAWASLLSNLGVGSCPPDSVINLIQERYNVRNLKNLTVSNAVAHVRYLYWFLSRDEMGSISQFRLVNQHGRLLREDQCLYFPNAVDDYSPSKLFQQNDSLPGFPVNFIHEDYLKAVDGEATHNGRSWMRWLEEIVGVRWIPKLCSKRNDALSSDFQYIIDHRSDKILGTLKRGWTFYHSYINGAVGKKLRKCAVLLENGDKTPLQRTFLPFPKLKQIVADLCITDGYPFIAVSEVLRDEEYFEWIFIKDLHVGIEDNLDFYLSALETLQKSNPDLESASARGQLASIYWNIQSRCNEDLDRVRDIFKQPLIWLHPSKRIGSTWFSAGDCIWDGPQWLKSKQCLKLEAYLGLEHLFKIILKIPDASQKDVINDLVMLKSHSGDENATTSQFAALSQATIGTTSEAYHATSAEKGFGTAVKYQSVSFMKAFRKQSFEELRPEDYDLGRKPVSIKTLPYEKRAFAGLQHNEIIREAEKRYDYLLQRYSFPMNDKRLERQQSLRFTFEDFALVYIPNKNTWCPPSQCVWAESSVNIPGKSCIADVYPSKKAFFTTTLGISVPTIEMYIESLKAKVNGKASIAEIKDTLVLICGLGAGEADLSTLVEAKILPVKLANGKGSFVSASPKYESVDFAIVENAIHWKAFKGKIAVLDFTLEELRDTKPLLLAMGLAERFSSKLIKEITEVRGGSQNHDMTRTLRSKSQAIVRCALHFTVLNKRQDVPSLYQQLQRSRVYLSDDIMRSLQITQGGRTIEGASSRANFHIEKGEAVLRFYLPKDEFDRDVCLESDLPRKLCTFLGTTDSGAASVIGGVFRKDSLEVIDKILENAGVGQADCDFAALNEELGVSEAGSDVETLVEATGNTRLSARGSGLGPAPDPYTPSDSTRQRGRRSGSDDKCNVHDKVLPSPSYQERQRESQKTAYKRILENVVDVARQRVWHSTVFESTGGSIQGPMAVEPLTEETVREVTSTPDRNTNIGAAGELYVFEYLKGLGLPKFSLDNWKSEIRDRVKIHASYRDLKNVRDQSAIADIEYLDVSSMLTQFLIHKGHLAQDLWDNEEPFYHIEVKTTTSSDWQEPFFMSEAQERHIQRKHFVGGKSRSSVYMIWRIFNLGKGDETGMHIYVDPDTKRKNGELDFTTPTWAVKPLMHPTMLDGNSFAGKSAAPTARTAPTTAGVNSKAETNKADSLSLFTTDDDSRGANRIFESSILESRKETDSPAKDLVSSDTAPISKNTFKKSSKSGLFGGVGLPQDSPFNLSFGNNTPNNVPSGTNLFGGKESPGNLFGFGSSPFGAPSGGNASTQIPLGGNSLGKPKPPQGGLFGSSFGGNAFGQSSSNSNLFGGRASTRDTPQSSSFGATGPSQSNLFDSSVGSKTTAQSPPMTGLFGAVGPPHECLFGSSSGSNAYTLPVSKSGPFGGNTIVRKSPRSSPAPTVRLPPNSTVTETAAKAGETQPSATRDDAKDKPQPDRKKK